MTEPQWAKRPGVTTRVSRLVAAMSAALGVDLTQRMRHVRGGLGQTYFLPSTDKYFRINTSERGDVQGRISLHVTRHQHAFFAPRADNVFIIAAVMTPLLGHTKAQRREGQTRDQWCVVTIPYAAVRALVEAKLLASDRAALFVRIAVDRRGTQTITLSDGLDLRHREGMDVLTPLLVGDSRASLARAPHDTLQAAAVAVLESRGYECTVPANNVGNVWRTGMLQDIGASVAPRPHSGSAWGAEAPDVVGVVYASGSAEPVERVVLEVAVSMSPRDVCIQLAQRWHWCRRYHQGIAYRYIVVADASLCDMVRERLASDYPHLDRLTEMWAADRVLHEYQTIVDRGAQERSALERVSCCPVR